MGFDRSNCCQRYMSLDLYACAICVWSFKGEQLLLFLQSCEKAIVIQSTHFIHVLGVVTDPIISLTKDDICSYHVPWILDVVSNDLDAGTPFAHVCCFCCLSIHVGMQVMILMRSYYRLLSLAITSVDRCCHYIIIQNSISCRIWL